MAREERPFRLTDLMVLIAALAVGFGVVREGASKARAAGYAGYILPIGVPEWLAGPPALGNVLRERYVWVPLGDWRSGDAATRLMGAWTTLGPCLLAATLATIGLRLWPPRPPARELWGQPGWVGCVVAVSTVGVCLAPCAVYALQTGSRLWILDLFEYAIVFGPIAAALGIVVAWLVLLVSRRWRAGRSWIDRLGRLLAVGYVAAGAYLGWFLLIRL